MVIEYILTGIICVLLIVICWLIHRNEKQIDDLTNKILARDLSEYVRVTNDLKPKTIKESKQEKVKKVTDPVLGSTY